MQCGLTLARPAGRQPAVTSRLEPHRQRRCRLTGVGSGVDRGLHDLSFRVWVDRQLTLRICPVIDGTSIIERFRCLRVVRGLEGLALGTRDASRFKDLAMGARVPLLSCDCGAYDCRVVADITRDANYVSWHNMMDSRTGELIPDMWFSAADYDAAVAQAATSLHRTLGWYRVRLFMAIRDDSLPLGAGSGLDVGLMLAFMVGFAVNREDHPQWAPLGVEWWLWCGAFVALNVTRDLIMRRIRGGDLWLDGPLHGRKCPWHPRIRYLRLNHRRSYGIFRFLRTQP